MLADAETKTFFLSQNQLFQNLKIPFQFSAFLRTSGVDQPHLLKSLCNISINEQKYFSRNLLIWGARKLTGENLIVVWAEFTALS